MTALLKKRDAAAVLNVSERTINRLVAARKGGPYRDPTKTHREPAVSFRQGCMNPRG